MILKKINSQLPMTWVIISLFLTSLSAISDEIPLSFAKELATPQTQQKTKSLIIQPINSDLLVQVFMKLTWLGLNTLEKEESWSVRQKKCHTVFGGQEPSIGIRSLYCDLSYFLSYQQISELAQLPIFIKGPHTDTIHFNAQNFGFYNKEFILWLQNYAIPAVQDPIFREMTQPLYDRYLKNMARIYFLAYQHLQDHPSFLERVKTDYLNNIKTGSTKRSFETPGWLLGEEFRDFADIMTSQYERFDDIDWYNANTAGGFWVRRTIDGTKTAFFDLLKLILKTYDSEYLTVVQQ